MCHPRSTYLAAVAFVVLTHLRALGQEGSVPGHAAVSVGFSDDTANTGKVRLAFSWTHPPAFPRGKVVEFSVNISPTDRFAVPIDIEDFDPNVGVRFSSNFPCGYRDIYNNASGSASQIATQLTAECGVPRDLAAEAALPLFLAISKQPDRARQFAVGSSCPDRFLSGVEYSFEYYIRRDERPFTPGHCAVDRGGGAWIIHDAVWDLGCPLLNGDVVAFLPTPLPTALGALGIRADIDRPPLWINRLCVPTDELSFIPPMTTISVT